MKDSEINKAHRHIHSVMESLVNMYAEDMPYDKLVNLSGIVLEHILEASAPTPEDEPEPDPGPGPSERVKNTMCGECGGEDIFKNNNKVYCADCEHAWLQS